MAMLPTSEVKRIIWAVDAFQEERRLDRAAAMAMRALFKRSRPEIEPVYVLVPDEIDRLSLSINDFWHARYRESATQALQAFTSKLRHLPRLLPPRLLDNERGTVRSGIEALNAYARESKADLIVVSSHARKGLARMFLGSFAETLLLRSETPVLCINPHQKAFHSVRTVLFPTDLSDISRESFNHVTRWAAEEGARIALVHLVPDQLRSIAGTGIMMGDGGYYVAADILEREFQFRKDRAAEWAEWAKESHGVNVRPIVRHASGDIAGALLRLSARIKPQLIAMTTEKGPASAILMGSTTRQVVRGANAPVWVFHAPKRQAESRRGLRRAS